MGRYKGWAENEWKSSQRKTLKELQKNLETYCWKLLKIKQNQSIKETMGGLKLLHSTAKTGKRQMQTDGGINRWHTWRAHKPFLNSISSTSWTFGESSGFLVIRYRSAGARLWKTHKVTHSLSPFHMLHSLRGITRTSWDLIKKRKETVWRDCCVRKAQDTASRRTEGMMREKEDLKTTSGLEWRQKKGEKNQCSIFLLYLVSFSPCGPAPQGKARKSRTQRERVGKGTRMKLLTS